MVLLQPIYQGIQLERDTLLLERHITFIFLIESLALCWNLKKNILPRVLIPLMSKMMYDGSWSNPRRPRGLDYLLLYLSRLVTRGLVLIPCDFRSSSPFPSISRVESTDLHGNIGGHRGLL
jgi:hypothetical protein